MPRPRPYSAPVIDLRSSFGDCPVCGAHHYLDPEEHPSLIEFCDDCGDLAVWGALPPRDEWQQVAA